MTPELALDWIDGMAPLIEGQPEFRTAFDEFLTFFVTRDALLGSI